jgi:hypothetical protein
MSGQRIEITKHDRKDKKTLKVLIVRKKKKKQLAQKKNNLRDRTLSLLMPIFWRTVDAVFASSAHTTIIEVSLWR